MTLPVVFTANGPTGYNLTKSLRIRKSASAYLSRTPSVAGNRNIWTISFWFKRGQLSGVSGSQSWYAAGTGGNIDSITINANDKISIDLNNITVLVTTQVFRDPSAWYHLVFAVDTSQATASNRAKLYINGSLVTAFDTDSRSSITNNLPITNTTVLHKYGYYDAGILYADIYYTENYLIDGQQLTASSFGSTNSLTGVWQPAQYTSTYGTTGSFLQFTDVATTSGSNAGLGKDFSGNGNYWTTNNISVTAGTTYDSMNDVPTLTSATTANYCVLNPVNSNGTVSGGNLNYSMGNTKTVATMAMTAGKYYFEVNINSTSNNLFIIGIGKVNSSLNLFSSGVGYYADDGTKYVDGANSGYGSTYTAGDILGIAVNFDSSQVTFYKNNTSQGAITFSSSTDGYTLVLQAASGSTSATFSANFGQRPFSYTPPTGFVALNTFNLPEPSIKQGNKYMDATLYTGVDGVAGTVTNAGSFKPDLVWIKARAVARDNRLTNSVVGTGYNLSSNSTASEVTSSQYVTSFNSNGFSYGVAGDVSEGSMVGWQWQAGQGTTSSNTAGSITSTVSANPTAGFSVVTFTSPSSGTCSFGHGLGVTPAFVIVKSRASGNWICEHTSTGTQYLLLNGTGAATTDSSVFNSAPTSSVVNLGTGFAGTVDYVAYCWSEIAGFSKFGSYTGNGSTDGPFVYTGFRPKFIMMKCSSNSTASTVWTLFDTSRSPYNASVNELYANSSSAEGVDASGIDILSNGFKPRRNSEYANFSGWTYIYMAFAENPFKNALAR